MNKRLEYLENKLADWAALNEWFSIEWHKHEPNAISQADKCSKLQQELLLEGKKILARKKI